MPDTTIQPMVGRKHLHYQQHRTFCNIVFPYNFLSASFEFSRYIQIPNICSSHSPITGMIARKSYYETLVKEITLSWTSVRVTSQPFQYRCHSWLLKQYKVNQTHMICVKSKHPRVLQPNRVVVSLSLRSTYQEVQEGQIGGSCTGDLGVLLLKRLEGLNCLEI